MPRWKRGPKLQGKAVHKRPRSFRLTLILFLLLFAVVATISVSKVQIEVRSLEEAPSAGAVAESEAEPPGNSTSEGGGGKDGRENVHLAREDEREREGAHDDAGSEANGGAKFRAPRSKRGGGRFTSEGKSSSQIYRELRRNRPVRKDKLRLRAQQHHHKIATQWAKLLVKTSFSVNVDEICSVESLQRDVEEISAETLSQVKLCVRAIIAHSYPWDREALEQVQVQSEVANKMNINMNTKEFQKIIEEELSHVVDKEMLDSARKVFIGERELRSVSALPKTSTQTVASHVNITQAHELVRQHALKSWVHRDSSASTLKSKHFMDALDQSKAFFRACQSGVPLTLHKLLFQSEGESDPVINFTTIGSAGTVQHVTRFSDGIVDLIPEEDQLWGYESCAVVGNNAIKRHFGNAIDANEAVIRINHAPILGYEEVVGSKATFDVVTLPYSESLARGKNIPARVRLKASIMVAAETHTLNMSQGISQDLLQQFNPDSYFHSETLLLSPQFSLFVEELWLSLWNDLESIGYLSSTTTASNLQTPPPEFISVLFGLQVCSHLNLYGFQSHPTPKTYFGADSASASKDSSSVAYYILKHLSIWPNSDAFRDITLHK